MFRVPLITSCTTLTSPMFWDLVLLYHDRPHLINRKLLAAAQVLFYKISFKAKGIDHVGELFTKSAILYEMRKLKSISKDCITEDFIRNILECYDKNLVLSPMSEQEFKDKSSGIFISVRVLLPRQNTLDKCVEVVILDKNENFVVFNAVSEPTKVVSCPPFSYEMQLTTGLNLRVNIANFEDADTSHAEWLADKLFPKLLKWSENINEDGRHIKTLSQVDIYEYSLNYNTLKEKYSQDLLKQWPSHTKTNPQKYIYEDLAIASYLICMWSKINREEISFVDCGCGNGLLVYVLHQEGFKGYGIDIRRRPIWDIFPKDTSLKVGTVNPTSYFPDSTWIIGNHSDELTPWIPVIALKSSLKTNYFVLPCCPFDFSGHKYARKNTSVSAYSDYMDYIKLISQKCGFDTAVDKLRIPSTKRTCLVGVRKNDSKEVQQKTIIEIEQFISVNSPKKFTPRDNKERVRNCSQLSKNLMQRIMFACVKSLLNHEYYIAKPNGELWNAGTTLSLSDLSKNIPSADLKELKKECGGLQTLLRNHRYLFEVLKGEVKLRQPLRQSEDTKKYQNKPCWFLENHPQGCLFDSEECAYYH